MPHFPLLLLIPTVFAQQYSTTRLDVSNIIVTTNQPFYTYFNGVQGNGMGVQIECHVSSGTGEAEGKVSKSYPVNNGDRSSSIDDMSFELMNPAEWITMTCSVNLRMRDMDDAPKSVTDFVQLYAAADDDNFAPNSYPLKITTSRFPDHPDWTIAASINKRCSGGNSNNFNCNDQCTVAQCDNGPEICCPESVDKFKCSCVPNSFTYSTPPSPSPDPNNPNSDPDFCTNEDLYFWIMIGLACLSGLLLLLLIICLIYICCALSSEDEARKAQQTEPVRAPPPVYLSTPPRDPRYGYRGPPPLDPYGRPEAGYREEYVGVPGRASSSLVTQPSTGRGH